MILTLIALVCTTASILINIITWRNLRRVERTLRSLDRPPDVVYVRPSHRVENVLETCDIMEKNIQRMLKGDHNGKQC